MGDYIVAAIAGALFTAGVTCLSVGFLAGLIVGHFI
jgi:hypothetical protein